MAEEETMGNNIPADDLFNDERKILVNGRRYYTMTANKCTTCSGDNRYMYVKQKIVPNMVVIECPVCDSYMTLNEAMINMNLNK